MPPEANLKNVLAAMLCGTVMISFSGVWVKLAGVPPSTSAFYRVLFGGVILLAAVLFRKELHGRTRYHLWTGIVCGVAFALDLFCYHRSILIVGPGLATILGSFQVFILTGVGIVAMGEPVRPKFVTAVPLAFLGLFLLFGIGWQHLGDLYHSGVFLGFATALFYAVFILLLRKLQGNETGPSFYYVLMLVSFTTALCLGVQMKAAGTSFQIPHLKGAAAIVALALFSQVIGWILITISLPKIPTSFAGLILLLQPALAFIWDVIIFHRPTSLINWVGVLITLAAIYLGLTAKTGSRRAGGSLKRRGAG